jgi:hypothetical protein
MGQPLIRTLDSHARQADIPQRGSRTWSQAEIPGDIWFMLETHMLEPGGKYSERHVVIPDFWEARNAYRISLHDRATLYAFVRAPVDVPSGHLFAPLADVSHVEEGDVLVLRFKSGLVCMSVRGEVVRARPASFGRQVFP